MRLTVDANTFVSRFREDDIRHGVARAFFKRCESRHIILIAPALLLSEVAGAIARLRGEARWGEVAVTRMLSMRRLKVRSLDLGFAIKAARLAARHQLRGADAVYLAAAHEEKCDLITWDAELLTSMSGTRVITPDRWLSEDT